MKVENIQVQSPANTSFGTAFVTASVKNLGKIVENNVDVFNKGEFAKTFEEGQKIAQKIIDKVSESMPGKIKVVQDLVDKVDTFTLAAGSGSRFKEMATAVAQLRGKGELFNKITVPFEIGGGHSSLKMVDVPLSTNKFFAGNEGYHMIMNPTPTGSFGDIVQHYLDPKNPIKDVIVSCGDNVFDTKGENLLEFFVKTINNPKKQMGLMGVERTPVEVADKFGVLKVATQKGSQELMSLEGFSEKPPIDEALKLVTPSGNNIANTGMFVVKKDAMEKLMSVIKGELAQGGKSTIIAKNDSEIYDFANVQKWVQKEFGAESSDVKIVKTWEDVGEPAAYKRWLDSMKDGSYIKNFSESYQAAIKKAVGERVQDKSIQFTTHPIEAKRVDGLKIIG